MTTGLIGPLDHGFQAFAAIACGTTDADAHLETALRHFKTHALDGATQPFSHGLCIFGDGERQQYDETVGTLGEAPERARIVESSEEVSKLPKLERPVFVVTQTTLSVDDTAEVIDEVRTQYPQAEVRNDICYATTNRQLAVRTIAERADLVLVVGSPNSSNSVRLREVAEDAGTTAYRVDGIEEIDPVWYDNTSVVGLTAGASVPDELLDPIIDDLKKRGVTKIEPVVVAEETIEFRPPEELELRR